MIRKALTHPVTRTTRVIVRRTVIVCAVILAVAFVTTVSVDLGPSVRELAEREGSNFLERPMHIGQLSVRLWDGQYRVEDLVIDGLTPESPPFLTAKLITISMPWHTLFNRRVVFDEIEMTDWRMQLEYLADGRHSLPKLTPRGPRGPSRWTTTLSYVRAHRGEFVYQDHGTPWSIVTRNLDVTVSRPASEYRGEASFSDGLVAIQDYVPFRADMDSAFKIVDGRVVFDAINLTTEGTRTVLEGDVNLAHWPEQMYSVRSTIQLPRMRELFFADDDFALAGRMTFDGVFHLFKDVRPDGTTRTGRELKGDFRSDAAWVDDYRFDDLRGYVRWIPEALEVHDATARLYGGTARFEYAMAPLGAPGVRPVNRFDAAYRNVDLTQFTDFLELRGLRLAGRASGENLLVWPSGGWAEHAGEGEVRVAPPPGIELMTRRMPEARLAEREAAGPPLGPFSAHTPLEPVPVGGAVAYAFGPEWVDLGPSRIATPDTYVEIEGRTAYGERSRLPFHVSSADWQESDRLFAGVLTAFGSPTNAIPIGGYGTFDGVMLGDVRGPRIEGTFHGRSIRAFDVTWGAVDGGDVVIENNYADVTGVVISSGDATITTDGRFSLGFPRRDGGEEIDARVRIARWPMTDLRQAFGLNDYDVDGTVSGEFHVYDRYLTPLGVGTLEIADGLAYGEPFERATAEVQLEGAGVRLTEIEMRKGSGRGTGAAYVGFDGTYSFNFDGRDLAVEELGALAGTELPLSGLIDVSAGGTGTFEDPRYDVRGTIRDFFFADEGIGRVVADLSIASEQLTIRQLEAASARLAVSGNGIIALTPEREAELTFRVADTSLDPYVRALVPRLSPYTNAVASGTVQVRGPLADIDRLVVDTSVERLDLRLFDYAVRNAMPIRLVLDRHTVRVSDLRLIGQDTQLDLSGLIDLHDERIAMRAIGDANLGILQGFVGNIRSSGRATLAATFEGPLEAPFVTGKMTIANGRLRHFSLPHALDNISGAVAFDTRALRLDDLTAELGGGPVRFGGTIGIEGYYPGRIDVTMRGEDMRLRFPAGMRSTVDADLALQGTEDGLTLSGSVQVLDANYRGDFGAAGLLGFTGDETAAAASDFLAPTLPLTYDVGITAPSTLRVQNDLLSQFVASAELQLRGTFDRPLLFGRVDVERGEITFEGRRYIVRRGTIDFNNPTRIEPFYDIETEARVRVPGETYRVTVRATGTEPNLDFSSDPELPREDVLALLLTDLAPGRDVEFRRYSDVTPEEQLLRERATRALTGVVSSEVGRVVEETFGVDTFQLTPTLTDPGQQSSRLDPAARVTIGKRLSDRVYLTYSRSLSSTTRDQIILLEIDQTDQLSWILSRNEDGTYALDLRVRRTF